MLTQFWSGGSSNLIPSFNGEGDSPSVESDFSKATQVVPRIAIVLLGPAGVRDESSPGILTFLGGQVGKSEKGPCLLLPTQFTSMLWSPVLPGEAGASPR